MALLSLLTARKRLKINQSIACSTFQKCRHFARANTAQLIEGFHLALAVISVELLGLADTQALWSHVKPLIENLLAAGKPKVRLFPFPIASPVIRISCVTAGFWPVSCQIERRVHIVVLYNEIFSVYVIALQLLLLMEMLLLDDQIVIIMLPLVLLWGHLNSWVHVEVILVV